MLGSERDGVGSLEPAVKVSVASTTQVKSRLRIGGVGNASKCDKTLLIILSACANIGRALVDGFCHTRLAWHRPS